MKQYEITTNKEKIKISAVNFIIRDSNYLEFISDNDIVAIFKEWQYVILCS